MVEVGGELGVDSGVDALYALQLITIRGLGGKRSMIGLQHFLLFSCPNQKLGIIDLKYYTKKKSKQKTVT